MVSSFFVNQSGAPRASKPFEASKITASKQRAISVIVASLRRYAAGGIVSSQYSFQNLTLGGCGCGVTSQRL